MALQVELKPGERIIVGECAITNCDQRTRLTIDGAMPILREKDILTEENRFVITLLKLWLKKNRTLEQVREELTEVNPIANRFIEIGQEFQGSGLYEKAIENFREALASGGSVPGAELSEVGLRRPRRLFRNEPGNVESIFVGAFSIFPKAVIVFWADLDVCCGKSGGFGRTFCRRSGNHHQRHAHTRHDC